MTLFTRERVARYVARHPGASVVEVLGALELAPTQRALVEDLLGEDESDATIDSGRFAVPVDEQCCIPRCHEPRVNPHANSLCADHHPGETTRARDESLDQFDSSAEETSPSDEVEPPSNTGDKHLAEAEAIAGYEPNDDASEGSDPEAASLDELTVPEDDDKEEDADFLAAAMGDPDASAAFASDDHEEPEPMPRASGSSRPVGVLPLAQLDALPPTERRRLAHKRGLYWPSTDEVRERLADTIYDVMRHEDDRVIDAPTSAGKSYTVATTDWGSRAYEDVTGDRPVIHLSKTRDARDEAIRAARSTENPHFVLQARHEACPVAGGQYDPPEDPEKDVGYTPLTVDGKPVSDWIGMMCDGRGLPFSAVHDRATAVLDQDVHTLPCCEGDHGCAALTQWERFREGDHDLVFATHNFAHVPGVRTETNVVFDEEPDFAADLSTNRVRRAVTAYLQRSAGDRMDAALLTYEDLIHVARHGIGAGMADDQDDQDDVREVIEEQLAFEPDIEWYFEVGDAHTLAPALARAIYYAEDRENARRVGKTRYQPPRLDQNAREEEGWNASWVTVVLDDSNEVRRVRTTPDLEVARSVVGLDAHPALPVWQANTLPYIHSKTVLEREERQLWRRYERGLRVVQVGEHTHPLASGEYFSWDATHALVGQLHHEYGEAFSTAITASSVESDLEDIMVEVGVDEPRTMHYGEEKSRNDFGNEEVGFVNGCIDPGDDFVVDLLAELDLDATPERSETECDHCGGDGCPECDGTGQKRAHGRGFEGEDADTAAAILASVRENHTAQAAGRWARNPDDPASTATVFVRTDAMPTGFADVQVPGVEWIWTEKQRRIVEAVRSAPGQVTARDVADETGVSKRHVLDVLDRLVEHGSVVSVPDVGPNGATLYADSGVPHSGVVDLGDDSHEEPRTGVTSTWSLAIREPSLSGESETARDVSSTAGYGRFDRKIRTVGDTILRK